MGSMNVVRALRHRLATLALAGALALLATPALAEEPAADDAQGESAAESRAEAFRAVEGAVEEDIAGGPLMLGAYAITWVFLFLYVVRLTSLQQRTQREVERLAGILSSAGGDKE